MQVQMYWNADATAGYHRIVLEERCDYKTAFNTPFSQCCYLRIAMGLSGAAHTYARMKNIMAGSIPKLRTEEVIIGVTEDTAYEFFQDDNYGASTMFEVQATYLHEKYFPRIAWVGLQLKEWKSYFWTKSLTLLVYAGSREEGKEWG
jgi:hypothetical protein